MAKTLDDYLKEITTLAGGRDLSTAWFRDKIRQIVPKRIAEGQMRSMIRAGDHSTRPIYGIMNLYYYMPKYEKTLPYYDVFPLVIPIKRLPGGFLGLNFHYLSVPMRVKLLEIIAQIHFSISDYKGSEKLYRESLNIREKFIFDKQNSLAQCSNNLAAVLRIKGELQESEHYTKKALEIWERIFSSEHKNVGIGLNNLGVIYKLQARYEEAEATLSKALIINEKCLGKDHIELAPDYNNMAQLMHSKGNYAPAETYYQKATSKDRAKKNDYS